MSDDAAWAHLALSKLCPRVIPPALPLGQMVTFLVEAFLVQEEKLAAAELCLRQLAQARNPVAEKTYRELWGEPPK